MTVLESDTPTLLELIARRWETGSSVKAAIFSSNSAHVAFVSADGKVRQTATADSESPTRRFRVAADTGRATISPRQKAVPPLTPSAFDDEVVCITAFHNDSFALGCRSGRLVTLSGAGRISAIVNEHAPIDALASTQHGAVLFAASAGHLKRHRANGTSDQRLASCGHNVAGLATSVDAQSVAWLDEDGLHIWNAEGVFEDRHQSPLEAGGGHALAWSPSGRWLAVAPGKREIALLQLDGGRVVQTTQLPNYPSEVGDLSWNAAGDLLATNGAFRIIVWNVGRLETDPTVPPLTQHTGRSGYVAVSAVAVHPQRPIIAAGYDNGSIVVAQTGGSDEITLRDPSQGKATVMCWSPDGDHLAVGTTEGEAIIVTFPPHFFR